MLFGLPLLIEKQNGCHNRKGHVYLWVWLTFLCLPKWWNCWGSCWWVCQVWKRYLLHCIHSHEILAQPWSMRSWPRAKGLLTTEFEIYALVWSLVNVVDSAQNLGTLVVPQLNGSQVDRGQSIARIIPLNRIVYWRGGNEAIHKVCIICFFPELQGHNICFI